MQNQIKELTLGNINLDINKLPENIQEEIYFNFFFNISDFIYNIWNLKVIDYDGEIQTKAKIKTSVLENNNMIYKDTIKEELSKLPLGKQLDKLFFDETDYKAKFKFYINYMQLHNSYLSIKTEKLLDLSTELEELSIYFEKKI